MKKARCFTHTVSPATGKEIRKLYKTGNYTHRELAKKYKVHYTNIGKIANNKTWNHIKKEN